MSRLILKFSHSTKLLKTFNGFSRSINNATWRSLVNLGIASNKPTKPVLCGAGVNKQMGTRRSKSQHHEVPYVPVCDITINDGDIRRLWSYNSTCTSGGKYVFVTNNPVPEGSSAYVVAATGAAQGTTIPLTDIRFDVAQPIPLKFELKFKKDNTWYAVNGSENDVIASEITDTSFEVIELWSPNRPYVVLRSNKKLGDDDLFLSSDGAGNMQLKVWNKPIPDPPNTTSEVDPALLFRVVRPFGQE